MTPPFLSPPSDESALPTTNSTNPPSNTPESPPTRTKPNSAGTISKTLITLEKEPSELYTP